MTEKAKVWKIDRNDVQPEWTHHLGTVDLNEQALPDGHWLVFQEGLDANGNPKPVMVLMPEHYEEWLEKNR